MTESDAQRQAISGGGPFSCLRGAARALFLGMSLLLAACQATGPGGRGPQATGPAGPAEPGLVTPGLPVDTERHRIALLVPVTGQHAGVGRAIANATTMALLDTKAENLRVTTYDTAAGAAVAARRAIADGNALILGPLLSEDTQAAAPIARAAHVPIISFSNDAGVAGNGTYLLGYMPGQAITRVVRYAHAHGANEFAALVPSGVYGERAGSALLQAVRDAGGTVVAMEVVDARPESMAQAARKLEAASGYDAVLIADAGPGAVRLAPVVRKNGGADARLLGTELWNTDTMIATSPALRGAWFASVSDSYYRQLADKYRQRFRSAPYRIVSLGYDAILLSVRIAQDWKPGTPFPVGRLADPGGFLGIDGAFRFGRDGIAERALEVQQVDSGKLTVVDPAPQGFAR